MAGPWDAAINAVAGVWQRVIDEAAPPPSAGSLTALDQLPNAAVLRWAPEGFLDALPNFGLGAGQVYRDLLGPSYDVATGALAPSYDPLAGLLETPTRRGEFVSPFQRQEAAVTGQTPAKEYVSPFKKSSPAPATTTTTPTTTAPTASGGTAIEAAIDKHAAGDTRVALAMRMGVLLETGNFESGGSAVGDNGQSHGWYQIHQPAHGKAITPEQSRDPEAATRYMLSSYQAGVKRVTREQPTLWQTDPYQAARLAAFYAERPAVMYPDDRYQRARAQLVQRQTAPTSPPTATAGVAVTAIAEAQKQLGKPYKMVGPANNPAYGAFDCSGLVQWAFGQAGVQLPRVAQQQFDATQRIREQDLRPGDLVFFTGTYDAGTPVTHVGIYIGNGRMLQASSSGNGVGYADLNTSYWRKHLYGYGRVPAA